MRAVLCESFEGIGALRFGETAEPLPADDEVMIDVHAASVSYMDYLMICGGYQLRPASPLRPGNRCSRNHRRRRRQGRTLSPRRPRRLRQLVWRLCRAHGRQSVEERANSRQRGFRRRIDCSPRLPHRVVRAGRTRPAAARRNHSDHRRCGRRRPGLRGSGAPAWRPRHCGGRIGIQSQGGAR